MNYLLYKRRLLLPLLLFLSATFIYPLYATAQSNQEKARQKVKEAIRLMDEGEKYKEAIQLLEECKQLDPSSMIYSYEIAYARVGLKEYKKAIQILNELRNHPEVDDIVYQMLGNAYDYDGQPEKAMEAYNQGLKLYPNSGKLYVELGNMKRNKQEYLEALPYYEAGIKVDPSYSTNYYWAAKIFCNSSEPVWGLIYGELFLNLNRSSARTREISKLLFDTYKRAIVFHGGDSISVHFSKNNSISVDPDKPMDKLKIPFPLMAYAPNMALAVGNEDSISLESLCRIRSRFIKLYFGNEAISKMYPNVLFDFNKKLNEKGMLDSYNHWVLAYGDMNQFKEWVAAHEKEFDRFIEWYTDNPMPINNQYRFYRSQYDD